MKLKVKTSMNVLKSIAGCDPPNLAFFHRCPGLGLAASHLRVPSGDPGTSSGLVQSFPNFWPSN